MTASAVFAGVKSLQQHLPLAVLKRFCIHLSIDFKAICVATVLTAHGIETIQIHILDVHEEHRYNSTYRLRY